MVDQQRKKEKDPAPSPEEIAAIAARRTKKYLINREILAKLLKEREEQRRRVRRFVLNSELLATNGSPGQGARIIEMSMDGARLELPYSPPFMSQMVLTFSLGGSEKVLTVVGRVLWSRMTMQAGWYEVGMQFYQNHWEIDQLLRLERR
jgi:hypothetical protein